MKANEFIKITPTNGFDEKDPNNARQNNYAWSMAEFGDYIYVGTGRNIVYLPMSATGLRVPELTPDKMDNLAEVWRIKKNKNNAKWEKVFKSTPDDAIFGFRIMATYTDRRGRTGLVLGCTTLNGKSLILVTFDGKNYKKLKADMPDGSNSRCMKEYRGKLYCGINSEIVESGNSLLLVMSNFDEGFVNLPIPSGKNMPKGDIMSFAVLDDYLYIGTILPNGCGVWKSNDPFCQKWQLVLDKGAGEGLNEWGMTLETYDNHVYLGTGILIAVTSVDPDKEVIPFKGFDLIRIDKDDQWEVLLGSEPILPNDPETGTRKKAVGPSGFGSMFNAYCWQIKAYKGKLYIGTWDCFGLLRDILFNVLQQTYLMDIKDIDIKTLTESEEIISTFESLTNMKVKRDSYNWTKWITAVLTSLVYYPENTGFDFYYSNDGINFKPISKNGFDNPNNYGLRNLLVSSDDQLYIGTANPYEGCEVWVNKD